MDRELKLTLNSRRFEIIAKYICIFLKKIFKGKEHLIKWTLFSLQNTELLYIDDKWNETAAAKKMLDILLNDVRRYSDLTTSSQGCG